MEKDILLALDRTFENVVENIVEQHRTKKLPEKFVQRIEDLLRYCVKPKMELRSLVVPLVYKTLLPEASSQNLDRACILGWCWQIMTSFVFTIDDFYEKTKTRFEKPTWSSLHNHSNVVVNDGIMIQSISLDVLRKYFKSSCEYSTLLDLLLDYPHYFFIGEYVEMWAHHDSKGNNEGNLEKNLVEEYEMQHKLLNGIGLKIPIKLAFTLAKEEGIDEDWTDSLDLICSELSSLLTFVDDYDDTYGKTNVRNLSSYDDITNGKTTWLIVKAMELSNSDQRNLLQKFYGNKENSPENIQTVLGVFEALEIPKLGLQQKIKMAQQLEEQIQILENSGHKLAKFLFNLLEFVKSYSK